MMSARLCATDAYQNDVCVCMCTCVRMCVCVWGTGEAGVRFAEAEENPSKWQQDFTFSSCWKLISPEFSFPSPNLAYFYFSENNYISLRHVFERKSSLLHIYMYVCI